LGDFYAVAGADSFAVEKGKGAEAVAWMNDYAKKNKLKFEARLEGYFMQSVKFGEFELISWKGDWPAARNIIKKVSGKLRIKTIESGYHEKKDLLAAMFGSAEFGKVYSGGNIVGQVELTSKGGRWAVKAESYF
jgi:hypothetical protein